MSLVINIYFPGAGMIGGATGAAVNDGNIVKGAVFCAFSGAANLAGGAFGSAMWGGAQAHMEGGSFGRGFQAAGIGGLGGGSSASPAGFIRSAILGGIASEITGGKFKTGAEGAAFMYAVSAGVNRISGGG